MDVTMNNDANFQVKTFDGEELTFKKICQIDTTDELKSYLIYTDEVVDESGFTSAYASIIDKTKEPLSLEPITSDDDWNIIEKFLYEMEDKKELE